ncbi:zinc ABC transporter substrate-binding protein [Vagococcus fluvialis]|uniref:metal ABC transporter substrate-binding protein n=1 Tax=Vagococcus fluvialis TaxID=2738 RepID=UPI001A8EB4B5|nr:metal ABC transporter substrate-binding protein [Vagococcus fluvialis]MBO0428043.1 zinc ABC transporter substrate-binding protein [Vagococcus fluvialis]
MKDILKIASLLLLLVGISACGKQEAEKEDGKLEIVTSFYPMYDFTKNVAKDKANVSMLIDGGVESHDYEPSAKDMAKIQNADVFVYNSNEMETWVETVLENIDTSKVKVIEASKGIELLKGSESHDGEDHDEHADEEEHEGHNHDHGHSHAFDPHVWLDPLLVKKEVRTISEALIEIDSKNKDYYEKNTTEYLSKLDKLNNDYVAAFEGAKSRKFVTQHTAFSYLANQYGLEQVAISGLSPDQEPTPKELKGIQDLVKKENINVIYTESSASEKIAKTIADATGAELAVLNPMESVSKKDRENGADYLSIMAENLEALKLSIK